MATPAQRIGIAKAFNKAFMIDLTEDMFNFLDKSQFTGRVTINDEDCGPMDLREFKEFVRERHLQNVLRTVFPKSAPGQPAIDPIQYLDDDLTVVVTMDAWQLTKGDGTDEEPGANNVYHLKGSYTLSFLEDPTTRDLKIVDLAANYTKNIVRLGHEEEKSRRHDEFARLDEGDADKPKTLVFGGPTSPRVRSLSLEGPLRLDQSDGVVLRQSPRGKFK